MLLAVLVASLVAVIRERPSLKHLGPLLLVWGLAMLMLIFIRDLGSSLMFFGGFLALLYVATGRLSLVGVGATMFLAGSVFFANNVAHVKERVDIWLDPFDRVVDDEGYQIAQSLFAQADGGLFAQGFGQALLELPGGGIDPARATYRSDLRGGGERARPLRRGRPDLGLPPVHLPWVPDRRARERRLPRSSSRPASRRSSPSRCS